MNAMGPQMNPPAVNPNYFQERYGKANPTDPSPSLPLSTATTASASSATASASLPDTDFESLANWSLEDLKSPVDMTFPLTGPEKADFEGSTVRFEPFPKAPEKGSAYESVDTILEDIGLDPKITKKVLGVVGGIVKGEAKIEKRWTF